LPQSVKKPYFCSPFAGFNTHQAVIYQIFKQKIREMQNYELMVIFTPVLSEDDFKAAQKKYAALVTDNGGEVLHNNPWGLKSLAYPIAKKTTGIYWVMEYIAPTNFNEKLKTQLLRDESVMRHMYTALDKYAVEYNTKKKNRRTFRNSKSGGDQWLRMKSSISPLLKLRNVRRSTAALKKWASITLTTRMLIF
jgi:small subunit ribosomal protein S6